MTDIITDQGEIAAIRNGALGQAISPAGIRMRFDGHSGKRFDSTIFTPRDLEFIESTVMAQEYAPLDGQLLTPFDTSVPDWYNEITGKTGMAGGMPVLVNASTSQIPNVDLGLQEDSWNFRQYAIGATWTRRELMASQAHGRPLDTDSASAAIQALFTQINTIIFDGNLSAGLKGYFDDNAVNRTRSVAGFNSNFTTLAILGVLQDLVNDPNEDTNNVERVNRLALSSRAYRYVSETPMSVDNGNSILKQFVDNNTFITSIDQVERMPKLNNITAGGGLGETAVAYNFDPGKVRTNIVNPATEGGIVQIGLKFVQLYTASVSEVQWRRPKSANIIFDTNRVS